MKELRLSMAMGGGVSLGTFSGSALTEAIKLTLIDNYYNLAKGHDKSYEKVTVDSFSGASAGGMSLGIMLRAFSMPPAEITEEGSDIRDDLEEILRRQFGDAFENMKEVIRDDHWNQILLAQYAQNKQHECWVKEVNINRLLRHEKNSFDEHVPSLLFRQTVDGIAKEHIQLNDGDSAREFNELNLLSDRVLFACTLSNLSPLMLDARQQVKSRVDARGMIGLKDPLRSETHRDMRVFDINYGQIPGTDSGLYPKRWYKMHLGDASINEARVIEDLRKNNAWQTIAATTIACGAFPFTFEPVILERHKCEFGGTWPDQLKDDARFSTSGDRYNFTYSDGGMFNNEPLREAFRLSYFLDNCRGESGDTEFDRKVLFVDPFVGEAGSRLGVSIYDSFNCSDSGKSFARKKTLSRIPDVFGSVIRPLINQSGVNESDKVYQKRDEFKLRDKYRQNLLKSLENAGEINRATLKELVDELRENLSKKKKKDKLPSVQTSAENELRRILKECAKLDSEFAILKPKVRQFLDDIDSDSDTPVQHSAKWYLALMLSGADILLDMEGVDEKAEIISISPHMIIDCEETGNEIEFKTEPIRMMGSPLFGFGGFFVEEARNFDFKTGRWAAFQFLNHNDFFNNTGTPSENDALFNGFDEVPDHIKNPDESFSYEGNEEEYFPAIRKRVRGLILPMLEGDENTRSKITGWEVTKLVCSRFFRGKRTTVKNYIDRFLTPDVINQQLGFKERLKMKLQITGLESPFYVTHSGNRNVNNRALRAALKSKEMRLSRDKNKPKTHTAIFEISRDNDFLWKGAFTSTRFVSLLTGDQQFVQIELPTPKDCSELAFFYNNILTADLSSLESYSPDANGVIFIDKSVWTPGIYLNPPDSSLVFTDKE